MANLLVFLLVGLVVFASAQPASVAPEQQPLLSARDLFKQGQFAEAAAAYRSLIAKDPSLEAAYAGLVQSLLKVDDVASAEDESRRALEHFPQSALLHSTRGDVYFHRGLMAEAEAEYESASKLDAKCPRAWLGKGKLLLAMSRQDQAQAAFTKALELDPDDGDILYNWAALLPYPQNVRGLEKHLAEYRSDRDDERRERDFVELLRHIAGRKFWVAAKDLSHAEIKMETIAPRPHVVRGAGLRVRFNDSASATLLLDTGATWVTIPRKLAEKIGARKISDYGLEGTGESGPAAGYFAWVDKVAIGELEFHDCLVHVSMKGDMGDIEGIVGVNVLAQHLVTLDFPAHLLRLTPLPALSAAPSDARVRADAPAERVRPFFSFGHLLLLPTQVNGSANGLFLLDTGANASSITTELAQRVGKLRDATPRVSGMSGEVKKVFALHGAALRFSPINQTVDTLT
ncbi:MAG: aspartyl protease family protein, partial [Terriglobales bacterium]